MVKVIFEFAGNGAIRWYSKDKNILKHLEEYVRHEDSLPLADRVPHPSLEVMERTASQLRALVDNAGTQEGLRSGAKGDYDNLLAQMKIMGNQVISTLKAVHWENKQGLELWGLKVLMGKYGIRVRKPYTDKQWMKFFATYLNHEASLPAAEQQTIVPYADFHGQWVLLQEYHNRWHDAAQERQATIEKRRRLAQEALLLLKWALVSIVMGKLKGQMTQAVEVWGYRLVTD